VEQAVLLATPALLVEQAARLAMPASPWSKPLGLPCRRSRRQSNTHPSCTGVPTPSGPQDCALHLNPPPPQGGASRQACHAGGPAGRATHTPHVRGFRMPSSPHASALHLNPPPLLFLSPCPPCSLWFAFSVPSPPTALLATEPCRVYGPACPPPLLGSPCSRMLAKRRRSPWSAPQGLPHRMSAWSKPPGLPCRRPRRQSHTIPNGTGVPTPSGPQDCALHLNPPRIVGADQRVRPLFSYLRVLCALCGLPSPCSLWFAFSSALPTPSHNLPQIFFPFLFNHFPTPPFSFSCSPLVC